MAISAANPLRSVASDAVSVAAVVRAIDRPGALVGTYGGPIITEATGLARANGLTIGEIIEEAASAR